MGRFSPGVVAQYYPGFGEGLAQALGNIAMAYGQRRREDRQAASADSLKRMQLIAEGFHPGAVPETQLGATATDSETGETRQLDPTEAAAAQADLLSGARQNRLNADTSMRATSASLDRFAERSPALAAASRPTATDTVASLGTAVSPGATGSSPVSGKPRGAFDPTSLSFNYGPKPGAVDVGRVQVGTTRGAQPEQYYYDPESSAAGMRIKASGAAEIAREQQQRDLELMRQRGENYRAGLSADAADTRFRGTQAAEDARTRAMIDAANRRTLYTQESEGARAAADRDLRHEELDDRLGQADDNAIIQQATSLANDRRSTFYGDIDGATKAVAAAHKALRQQRLAEQAETQNTRTFDQQAGPNDLNRSGAYTADRQTIDRQYQAVVNAIKAKLRAAVSELDRQHIQQDLDATYDEWGASLKAANPRPAAPSSKKK